MRGVWLLMLGLEFCTGAAQAADCQLKQYDSIDITVSPKGISVPVAINSIRKELGLAIQNTLSSIDQSTAVEAGLRIRSLPQVHDRPVTNQILSRGVADKFELGKLSVSNLDFLITPQNGPPPMYPGFIGSLVFGKLDFELDMGAGKLNLFSPDHCPNNVVYWTKTGFVHLPFVEKQSGFMRVNMLLDGQPVLVALQTTGLSQMSMFRAKKIFGIDQNSPGMVLTETKDDGRKFYKYSFKTLSADGLSISNPAITIMDDPNAHDCSDKLHMEDRGHSPVHSTEQPYAAVCVGGADLLLGMSVLGNLHLYVSQNEQVVYLTPASAR